MKIPESIQRRDFIKQLGLASTAALATNGSQAWGNEENHSSGSQGGLMYLNLDGGRHGGTGYF